MKKLRRRLLSVLLAFCCLAAELCGGTEKMLQNVQAAPVIERVPGEQLLDAKYRWQAEFIAGRTQATQVNCDNAYADQFLKGPAGDWGSAVTAGISSLPEGDRTFSEGNAPGCYYSNVGTVQMPDGSERAMDVKLSIAASYGGKSRYDFRTPNLMTVNPDVNPSGSTLTGVTYSWKKGMGKPCVSFLRNEIGLRIYAVNGVDVLISFYDHQTAQPLAVNGHGTLSDIDGRQSVSFPADSRIERVCLLDESEGHLTIRGNTVESGGTALPSGDRRGDISYFFQNTDSVKIHFDYQNTLEKTLEGYRDALGRAGSEAKLADILKKRFYGSNGETLMPDYNGGEWITSHGTFTYTARVIGRFMEEPRDRLEKRVGPVGCSWEAAKKAPKEDPYWLGDAGEFDYLARYRLVPLALRRFEFEDTLSEGLVIDGVHKIMIYDTDGRDVTGKFDITVKDGREITCTGRPEAIAETAFSQNQIYTFVMRVHRENGYEFPLEDDGYTYLLSNDAALRMQYDNPSGTVTHVSYYSEKVWAGSRIASLLTVKKQAEKYEWEVGDKISYTAEVTQTVPDAWAAGVKITDEDIPEELQLLDGFSVDKASAAKGFRLVRLGKNGWKCTGPRLEYNETVTIRFECLAAEAANGREWENYVYASADNMLDPGSGALLSPAFDRAEVWVNSPKLSVEKTAPQYEYGSDGEIEYRVTVANTEDYTLAREIVVEEVLPEGLRFKNEELPELTGMPETAAVPRDDGRTSMDKSRTKPTNAAVERTENGWRLTADYFPSQTAAQLVFSCVAAKEANGTELTNTVTVSGKNIADGEADETVYLNTPELSIEKSADHYEWQVGEAVAYQVKAENRTPGTIARSVVIRDAALPEGLVLQGGAEGIAVSGLPETIQNPVGEPTAQTSQQTEGFPYTEEVPVEYEVTAGENGWEVHISDLPAQTPVTLTFSCLATEAANGKEAVNRAEVTAENGERQEDEETIYVNTAVLSIEKEVRRIEELPAEEQRLENEYRVGETVEYEVRVRNCQPGSAARNVVLEDAGLPEYLVLSEEITADGVPEGTEAPSLSAKKDGWRLNIAELPYDALVTVVYRCEIGEAANGKEILNTAAAEADNAGRVTASQKIWINTPKLSIEKSAGKEQYLIEDTLEYTILVRQEAVGCTAGNLVIGDLLETKGVEILGDSVTLTDENGEAVEANRSVTGEAFVLSTGESLVKEENYLLWDPEKQEEIPQEAWNPPGLTAKRELRVTYAAKVTDPSLAREEVENVARVSSKEQQPAETTETTALLAPELTIVKESDRNVYTVGNVGYYHIGIEQLREGTAAKQITIEDAFTENGAEMQWETLQAAKNRKLLSDAAVHRTERGFVLETGTDLDAGERIDVCYQVIYREPSLAGKNVSNLASVQGTNAQKKEAEVTVGVSAAEPLLAIEKTSDKEVYHAGDTGRYTVTVTQKEPEATARDLVIGDRLLCEDEASVQLSSVKVKNSHGNVLSDCEAVPVGERSEAKESGGFTIRTGADLGYLESLTVEYQVYFAEKAAGQQIQNRAMATAANFRRKPEGEEDVSTYYIDGDTLWVTALHQTEVPKEPDEPEPAEPTKEPEPPKPSETPKETVPPKPSETPKESATPKPSEIPKESVLPKQTAVPEKPAKTEAPKETVREKSGGAETGDPSPVEGLAAGLCASLCAAVWLLRRKVKK